MGFKSAREAAGMAITEAAEKLGVSRQAIYYWETGEMLPEAVRLPKIAALYNVTIDELLKEE